jgi:hypothetical protein
MAEEKLEQEVLEDEGVEVEVEVKEEESSKTEIPVVTEEVKEEEPAPVETTEAETTEDELETYSTKVQNRIKKLTEKYRKEERDREEAVRMAQQLLGENQQLKNRMQNLDKGYLTEYGTRLDSEVINAKRLYKEAYEAGDADKMMEAQEAMSKMSIEQERLRIAKQRSEQVEVEQGQAQGQPAPQQAAQQQAPAPKPDPKAEAWAEKNEWFGSDEVMTYAAFGIHRKLVEEEGIDPSAEEYYTEVDRRMRVEFPHKFQAKKSGGAQVAPAGASATRSTAKTGRRSVKLSPSQIAMAKRLNVPLEEYAKYVKE